MKVIFLTNESIKIEFDGQNRLGQLLWLGVALFVHLIIEIP